MISLKFLITAHTCLLRIKPMYIIPPVVSLSAYTQVLETQHYQNLYHVFIKPVTTSVFQISS